MQHQHGEGAGGPQMSQGGDQGGPADRPGPGGPHFGPGPGMHHGGPGHPGGMGPGPGWDPWAYGPMPPPPFHGAGPQGPYGPPGYGPPPNAGPWGAPGMNPGASPWSNPWSNAGSNPWGNPPDFNAALGEMADQSGLGALKGLFNLDDGDFWKGAIVGAAVVLLLKDETLRETLLGSAARTADALKTGLGGFAPGAGEAAEAGEEVPGKPKSTTKKQEQAE